MKVAVFSSINIDPDKASGISNIVLRNVSYMKNKYHIDFTIYSGTSKKEKEIINFNGIEIRKYPIKHIFREFCLLDGIEEDLKNQKFDLVHSYYYGYVFAKYGFDFAIKNNIPHILTPSLHTYHKSLFRYMLFSLYSVVYGKIITRSSKVLTTSIYEKNYIENKFKNFNVDVLGAPINAIFYKKKKKSNKNIIIGYVAILEKWKGALDAFNIFKNLNKKYDNLEFIFIGKGSLENHFKANADKNFTFMKNLENDEFAQSLANIDILLSPTYYEAFGMINVEAMASGTPVICTDVGPLKEIIGNGGIVCERNELENSVVKLIENKKLQAQLSVNARKKALEYKEDKIADKLYKIYKSIVKL